MLSSVARRFSTAYSHILTSTNGKTGIIQLNRPDSLNALSSSLFGELNSALLEFDKSEDVHVVVITGNEKAFAAGADIKEMSSLSFASNLKSDFLGDWSFISKIRKPIIAAVNGFALGGGCELAMMCDIILAGDRAKFGQPEIKLGTIPGGGGTQRLIRAIGKSRAMEMILTGRLISAKEAESYGLVSKVYNADVLLPEALKMASTIAEFSLPIVMLAKEAVNFAEETSLNQGLLFEKRLFHSTFALNDQKIGMTAFLEKAVPNFTNE